VVPFAVCRCQRASGGFCSLSYMDASFFIHVLCFFSSSLVSCFYFLSKLHSLRSLAQLEHNPFHVTQYKPLQHKVYVYINMILPVGFYDLGI